MKVYELISALSQMPAAAEVEFQSSITLEDFAKCEVVDSINGRDLYALPGKINDVVGTDGTLVLIFR